MIQRITSSQFRLDGVQRRGKEKSGFLTLLSEFAFSTKRFEGIIKGKERVQGAAVAGATHGARPELYINTSGEAITWLATPAVPATPTCAL
jgi:hypothetical protein